MFSRTTLRRSHLHDIIRAWATTISFENLWDMMATYHHGYQDRPQKCSRRRLLCISCLCCRHRGRLSKCCRPVYGSRPAGAGNQGTSLEALARNPLCITVSQRVSTGGHEPSTHLLLTCVTLMLLLTNEANAGLPTWMNR